NQFVMRREGGELIRMRAERQARQFRNFCGGPLREFGVRIEARADRGAANRKVVKSIKGQPQPLDIAVQKRYPARYLLPDGERCSVLQVCTADLHDAGKRSRL